MRQTTQSSKCAVIHRVNYFFNFASRPIFCITLSFFASCIFSLSSQLHKTKQSHKAINVPYLHTWDVRVENKAQLDNFHIPCLDNCHILFKYVQVQLTNQVVASSFNYREQLVIDMQLYNFWHYWDALIS